MVKATYSHTPLINNLTITGTIVNIGLSPMTDKQVNSLLKEFVYILDSYEFEAGTLTIDIK